MTAHAKPYTILYLPPPQTPKTVMTTEYIQRPKTTYQTNTVYETKKVTKPVFTMEVGGEAHLLIPSAAAAPNSLCCPFTLVSNGACLWQ